MEVHPGDIIVADIDGVIAIPRNLAQDAIRLGKQKQLQEETMIAAILSDRYDDSWIDKTLKEKGAI
jgi:regulator of RNase E activity RraA